MGLFQQAYRTYIAMEKDYAGKYEEGKQPLAPVSHAITSADIEITLDRDGAFVSALSLGKDEPKILIPVTEESSGRTAAPAAHPLCDQLCYVSGCDEKKLDLYVTQLDDWANSQWTHPKLKPILHYVKSGTLLSDLQEHAIIELDQDGSPQKDKLLVRWRILDPDNDAPEECWKDPSLFRSFIDYYESVRKSESRLCMVSGEEKSVATQHPKGVISLNGNAKLISANDTRDFTYRGRFSEDWQAATVSYEVSQKTHAALRWIAANQGILIGGRAFLCWNPEGQEIKKFHLPFLPNTEPAISPSAYRRELKKTLYGAKDQLPKGAKAVLAAFDAATTGRLSVTYYNELQASDFLQRLHDWDETCCWWFAGRSVFSPYLFDIVNFAYGIPRQEKEGTKFVTDDKVMAQQLQRLVACRVNRARMPADILQRLVNRASAPQAYDEKAWHRLVYVTCAVIQKYYAPILKEDLCMEWTLDRQDRSFQFGRLLAVMEKVEADYYYKTSKDAKDTRQTNAIKSLNAFKQTPWNVFERINVHLENAYFPRLTPSQRNYYRKVMNEIVILLSVYSKEELNKPLDPFYLIGYELQRNDFFKHIESTNNNEEE